MNPELRMMKINELWAAPIQSFSVKSWDIYIFNFVYSVILILSEREIKPTY